MGHALKRVEMGGRQWALARPGFRQKPIPRGRLLDATGNALLPEAPKEGAWCGREWDRRPEPELVREITRAGGLNYRGEPNFRLVWGGARKSWRWHRYEYVFDPKYWPNFERWHLEMWVPAEKFGSPEQWHEETRKIVAGQSVEDQGPYPDRGDYELLRTFEGPNKGYLALTPNVCEMAIRLVEFSRRFSAADRKAMKYDLSDTSERHFDSEADAALSDSARAFHGQPFVSIGNTSMLVEK